MSSADIQKLNKTIAELESDIKALEDNAESDKAKIEELTLEENTMSSDIHNIYQPYQDKIDALEKEKETLIAPMRQHTRSIRDELDKLRRNSSIAESEKLSVERHKALKYVLELQEQGYFITGFKGYSHNDHSLGSRAHNNYRPEGWTIIDLEARATGIWILSSISRSWRKLAAIDHSYAGNVRSLHGETIFMANALRMKPASDSYICPDESHSFPGQPRMISPGVCPICRKDVSLTCIKDPTHKPRDEWLKELCDCKKKLVGQKDEIDVKAIDFP